MTRWRALAWVAMALSCVTAGCGDGDAAAKASSDVDGSASDAGNDASAFDASAFSALDPGKCQPAPAEGALGFDARYALASSGSVQQDKAFYVLTLLAGGAAQAAVAGDTAITTVADQRATALQAAVGACNDDATCWGQAAKWSDVDRDAVAERLAALAASSAALGALAGDLRKSGHAQLHAPSADAELLRAAWLDAANALDQGWDDHVAGLAVGTARSLVSGAAATAGSKPFFAPLLELVLGGLSADARDEASRYEPLAEGENSAAKARIPRLDFSKYPFATIVVPGLGPTDLTLPLSAGGQVRADQAAARFAAGLAPLIVLSGGHVHPDRTPYSEALEMKKYLIATYAIPEDALLVDPHARHTTTNLRNVARLLYRYGVPTEQPSLVTTDLLQTVYIAAAGPTELFGKRNLSELGYLPWRAVVKLDELDNCWIPSVTSLFADARDLLDP